MLETAAWNKTVRIRSISSSVKKEYETFYAIWYPLDIISHHRDLYRLNRASCILSGLFFYAMFSIKLAINELAQCQVSLS